MATTPCGLLRAMFDAAVETARPAPPRCRTVVVVTASALTNVNDFRAILVAEHLGGAAAQVAE